jgi:preprotein translocase subunit SecG
MSTIESVLLSLLVLDAIALTVLVLLQQGKGADVGAAFGSGSSNTMFGSLGAASFLTKATAWLAIGFFAIAFGLAYIAKHRANDAGTLGIPTLPTETVQEQLTPAQESVDSPQSQSDVPSMDATDSQEQPAGDIPEL